MKIIYCITDDLCDLPCIEVLSDKRAEQIKRHKNPADKTRCLASGLLLRYLLGDSHKDIVYNGYGKPYLENGVCFNIAHSGNIAVAVADERDVGIDAEPNREYNTAIAKKFMTEEENRWLEAEADKNRAFAKLWTGKESVIKAFGLGFSMPTRSFSVLPADNGAHMIHNNEVFMNWYDIKGYTVCVASQSNVRSEPVLLSREILIKGS